MSVALIKKSLASLTKEETDKLEAVIAELFASYPQVPMTELSIAVYSKHLVKIPIADLEEIVDSAIDVFPRMPSVGEIVEHYGQLLEARAKAATEAKRAEDRIARNALKKQPSTEVEKYLYALDHNVAARQAKEEPLLKQLRVAKEFNFFDDIARLTAEIAELRQYHQNIAAQIIYEFSQARPISYLKEIAPIQANNRASFGNAGSVAASVLRQNMTMEVSYSWSRSGLFPK